jgi:alpha-ribazole phosphatase
VYLIRHDQVALAGVCYGQSDVDSTIPYAHSAQKIKSFFKQNVKRVYSSPLKRCSLLAEQLFTEIPINYEPLLKEVNFGQWEQQSWSGIPRQQIDDWAQNPTNFQFPEGEHLAQFYQRVESFWGGFGDNHEDVCVVTHAGVIRLLLSLGLSCPWHDCLSLPVPFLSVIELNHQSFIPHYPTIEE